MFGSASHKEAVARIEYAIATRTMAVLTGEVGAGKTVAVRAVAAHLDASRHQLIYLPNPQVGARGIHHAVVSALGGVPRFHHATLIPQAADALAGELAERGRITVIIVDEAHLLVHDQLEAIRMLTNAELDSVSACAILLIGQPQLRHNMKLGVLAALDQRIAVRYQMQPMTIGETSDTYATTSASPAEATHCSAMTPPPSSTTPAAATPEPSTAGHRRPHRHLHQPQNHRRRNHRPRRRDRDERPMTSHLTYTNEPTDHSAWPQSPVGPLART